MNKKIILCSILGLFCSNAQAQKITHNIGVGIGAVTVSGLNTSNLNVIFGDRVDAYNKPSIILDYGIGLAHEKFSYGVNAQVQYSRDIIQLILAPDDYTIESNNQYLNTIIAPNIKLLRKKWQFGFQTPLYFNLVNKLEKPGFMNFAGMTDKDNNIENNKRFLYGVGLTVERSLGKKFGLKLEQNIPLKKQFTEGWLVSNQLFQTNLSLIYRLIKP